MTLAIRTSEVKFVKRGDKGAKLRMRDWADNVSYLCGDQGEDFYDVVIYNTKLYLCLKSHTSSTANNPQTSVANNLGFWALATDWQFVATKLLLAEKITADQIDANNLVAEGVDITGKITATYGKIGGLQISGNSLTNINGNNDAGVYLRNSTEGTFAAMGGNVVPSVGGFTMIADFENTKRYDLTDISSINYGLKLLAQNARTNIALTIDGGCVQGFAMRNTFINTGVTSRTLTRNDYNVICNNTGECTITLPSMQLYDDGHVVRIKRLNGNVLVKTSYCYVIDPETYTSKYVRPIIIYSDSQAVTGSSSNNLTMNTKGDGTELVWVRDYIGTVNGTTYYGAWIANKVSYM